jgi:F0F1-type ATP synthase delta subunit
MKKGLKILLIVLVAGALVLGGTLYSILSGKINISSSDLLSTAFAENVLMCNDNENGIHFKLMGPGIIEEVLKRLGLDETELKSAWESGKTLLEFAESKGITKEKLVQTFKDVITEKLDELLKDGKITETEKENLLKDIDSRIEDFITNTPPFGKGNGIGRGKPPIDKIPGEPPIHKGFFFNGKGIMEDVLTKLNLSLDEFQTAVKEGKSLLEFAESKGITKEKLVTVVKEVVTNKVEQLVKDGKMTEEQKTKFLSNLDDFVERFINGPR